MTQLAKNLQRILAEKGMSRKTLIKETGLDDGTVKRMLTGATKPQMKTIERIAETLDCKVEDLLGKNDNVGKNIKRICREKGLRIGELYSSLGWSSEKMHKIINGKYMPSEENITKIANALNVERKVLLETPTVELNLAQALKEYLKENEMTQGDFAAFVGISRATVNRIINGDTNVSVRVLKKLACAMQKNVEDLWK